MILTILLFLLSSLSASQTEMKVEQWDKAYPISIQDNSFFIEEAFNQDEHVVQHISDLRYFPKSDKQFDFSFTQEWPLWGMKHQISY